MFKYWNIVGKLCQKNTFFFILNIFFSFNIFEEFFFVLRLMESKLINNLKKRKQIKLHAWRLFETWIHRAHHNACDVLLHVFVCGKIELRDDRQKKIF